MREIIMDHYENPRHKAIPSNLNEYVFLHSSATNCIDDIDVFIKEINGAVADAAWNGVACTISTASTDILCDLIIGKTVSEALNIIKQFDHMIHEEPYDASVLDEALVFINTGKQAARIHCATMGWDAAKELLEKERK